MKWRKLLVNLVIATGFALALFIMVAATNRVQILCPADLAVMQELLKHEGYNVRVVSGVMTQANREVVVTMVVKLPNGTVRDMTYDMGRTK